jgi:hypothetical protein
MVSIQSYLRFPSKAPFAWFVYCIFYVFLYTVILLTQQTLINNAASVQKMLQIQSAAEIAYVIWYTLILIPLIQIAQSILFALENSKKLSLKMVAITIFLLIVLCLVVLYVFVFLTPTGSENLRPPKIPE